MDIRKKSTGVLMFLSPLISVTNINMRYLQYIRRIGHNRVIASFLDKRDKHVFATYGFQDHEYNIFNLYMSTRPDFHEKKEIFGGRIELFYFDTDEMSEEIALFKKGKYSEYSLESKLKLVENSYMNRAQTNIIERILLKDPAFRKLREEEHNIDLRGRELWSIYDPEDYLLEHNMDKLKEIIEVPVKLEPEKSFEQ